MASLTYAHEKLQDAVSLMASSADPLSQRLLDAYVSSGVMRIDALPEGVTDSVVHDQLAAIHAAFGAGAPEADEGIASAAVNSMSVDDLEALAERVVNVYLRVVSAIEDHPDIE